MFFKDLSKLSLETERVRIRPVVEADLKTVYAIHSVDDVNFHIPYTTWQSWYDAKDWFATVQRRREEESSEVFVVERKHDGLVIGTSRAFEFNQEDASLEFGYVLSKEAWGQGYMIESMTALLDAFETEVGIKSVRAKVESENEGSLKLLDKLKFKKTGVETESDGIELGLFAKNLS